MQRQLFALLASSQNPGASFDGFYIQEASSQQGTNTCWWDGSPIPRNPTVIRPIPGLTYYWQIAAGDVPGQHNTYGYDTVGLPSGAFYNIVNAGDIGLISLPCSVNIYQDLYFQCDTNTNYYYWSNTLGWVIYTNGVYNVRGYAGSDFIAY
jgi:hypothetical protein